jgi:hypothetical protein
MYLYGDKTHLSQTVLGGQRSDHKTPPGMPLAVASLVIAV